MALAFASVPASGPQAPAFGVALRGAALAPAPKQSGASLLAPLGATCAALGIAAVQRRSKRAPASQRHFFGGEPAPPPPPKSYKDFNDKWLASADLGFDPANLAVGSGVFDTAATAVPQTTYYNYRESEVKHGRFAMTAFLAIFFEEADRGAVLSQLGFQGAVDKLDGTLGLDEVQAPVLAIAIGVQALAEYNLQKEEDDGNVLSVEYDPNRCPGDLGFDPLKLQRNDENKKYLHNIEVNVGRLAMIGVTSFLVREFAIKDL